MPYSVEVSTRKTNGASQYDYTGIHYEGFIDDYACIVQLPASSGVFTHYKMMVMRRANNPINANSAEAIYRSLIHAAQATEYISKDNMDYWDTSIDGVDPYGEYQ